MKKIILSLTLLIPVLFFGQTLSEYYEFYETTGNYYHLTGATEIYQNQDSDDGSVTSIPIGFNFDYNGDIYNTCTISVNGAITFTELEVAYSNDLNATVTNKKNVVAPLWDDLYKRTADSGVIQYKTDGTAPYRRFYVEWKDISWRNEGQTVSFMLVLQETTNNIEFRYGPNNSTESRSASIGLNKYISSISYISVTPGDPASVSQTTANNAIDTSDYPGEDTFYEFKHLSYISDTNFEYYLETHTTNETTVSVGDANSMGNGIDGDHWVRSPQIAYCTKLSLTSKGIHDLSGISDFTRLTELYAHDNFISSTYLSKNKNLEKVVISGNNLTSVNVTNLPDLYYLILGGNNLTSLDLQGSPSITQLYIAGNQLSGAFDTSQQPILSVLECFDNNITSLDLDTNTYLYRLRCQNNQLTTIQLQNGNNGLLAGTNPQDSSPNFNSTGNPDLHCIFVDNATDANNGTGDYQDWSTSSTTVFAENEIQCNELSNGWTYVPDDNFENYLETHTATGAVVSVGDANSMGNGIADDDYVTTAKITHVTHLNLLSQSISDLTGIQDFLDLENLSIQNNSVTSLDLTANTNLQVLNASHNDINSLSLGNNTVLYDVNVSYNTLTSVIPSGNTGLKDLNVSHNPTLSTLNVSYNTLLEDLTANNTALTGIFLDNNTALKILSIANANLSTIDVSSNTLLESLSVNGNNLSSINLDNNTALGGISCQDNQLTSLDLSHNSQLGGINCANNNLTVLDLSHQDDIANIDCSNNQITNLIISEGYYDQSDLMYLYADHNQITELDLSGLETLEEIDLSHNALNFCNVANGNNTNFGEFNLINNPSLSCVQVDDATFMQNNWAAAIDAGASYSEACHYGETYVPDDNFEAYLEANGMGNGIANDDYVTTANIDTLISLNVSGQNIADLTGIEDFELLQSIICSDNDLTSLNFSQNIHLTSIYCHQNQLTSLDISANTNLVTLWCHLNNLSTLNIDNNTNLHTLYCGNNQLSALDVGHNTSLESLTCYSNQLSSIDVSSNPNLSTLWISYNQLSSLDLDDNTNIEQLWCNNNPNLTELRLQNGANNLLSGTFTSGSTTYARMIATDNPNLTCIYVDNASAANNSAGYYHDWQVDATATFVDTDSECQHLGDTYVPDDNFEAYLEANGMGNGIANDDYVTTANIENVTGLSVQNLNIADLTGIEDFTALQMLACFNNDLTSLDISHNVNLTQLSCNGNQLSSLDISNNPSMSVLNCSYNSLTTLDTSNNPSLSSLSFADNQISTIDLSQNTNLMTLICYLNNLTTLDLSDKSNLNNVYCNGNQLSSIDISNDTNLQILRCYNNNLTGIDTSSNTALRELQCYNNQLTNLDFSQNSNLRILHCYDNQLVALDLDANVLLDDFWCYNNALTELHLQNGANSLLSGTYTVGSNVYARMRALNNPNLTCLYVEDAIAAAAGTGDYQDWEVDGTVHFVETAAECQALSYNDYNQIQTLNLIPNPASTVFRIETESLVKNISIYDYTGRKVLEYAAQQTYDVSHLQSSVYYVVVTTEKGTGTKRLIIK